MINRQVIRTRALQIAYAYLHKGEQSLASTEKELRAALARTYDLYLFLLRLPVDLTEHLAELQEVRRRKHFATKEEKNPNYKLQDNRLTAQLRASETLEVWYNNFPLSWGEESSLLRHLVEKIECSDYYAQYLKGEDSYEADREFWVSVLQHIVMPDAELAEYLEEQSIYWDDELCYIEKVECEERPGLEPEDIQAAIEQSKEEHCYQSQRYEAGNVEVVKAFVLKSLKRAVPEDSIDLVILPMYRDEEDEVYAMNLLRYTILNFDKNSELIKQHLSTGWDKERLADMDELLIHMAITEFLNFPQIATSISINEYVELGKHYSTPKSSAFVNGVLDAIARELKTSKKILKQ